MTRSCTSGKVISDKVKGGYNGLFTPWIFDQLLIPDDTAQVRVVFSDGNSTKNQFYSYNPYNHAWDYYC